MSVEYNQECVRILHDFMMSTWKDWSWEDLAHFNGVLKYYEHVADTVLKDYDSQMVHDYLLNEVSCFLMREQNGRERGLKKGIELTLCFLENKECDIRECLKKVNKLMHCIGMEYYKKKVNGDFSGGKHIISSVFGVAESGLAADAR